MKFLEPLSLTLGGYRWLVISLIKFRTENRIHLSRNRDWEILFKRQAFDSFCFQMHCVIGSVSESMRGGIAVGAGSITKIPVICDGGHMIG